MFNAAVNEFVLNSAGSLGALGVNIDRPMEIRRALTERRSLIPAKIKLAA
jgi:hypothetical protein